MNVIEKTILGQEKMGKFYTTKPDTIFTYFITYLIYILYITKLVIVKEFHLMVEEVNAASLTGNNNRKHVLF